MTILAIILGLIPSFAWLLFYLREDLKHPEPKRLIFFVFILGGIATFLAFYLELYASDILFNAGIKNYTPISLTVFSFIEESLKFLLVFIFISRSKYFNEPVDAMIYMVTVALGFAAVENIAITVNEWNDLQNISTVFETITLRFIGATLLHTLSSGVIGYYWAKGKQYHEKIFFIPIAIILGTFIHAIFNFLILNSLNIIIPTMFLGLVGLFVLHDFDNLKRYIRF
ncbi:MAG: hypothetical protein COV57_01555 [Candidatus Liptonbacteria bacterium CG11_big_fil_rev_8_21_14_0_20_35_14]|uniref:Protease PrsW n=1 Tax=Candidatus Liptonbacteria bacterium CG11_big_fil_rev_8_21_14_0_20_35_14 TaxID=1974634 RepID=A0A2H0N7Y1_9BACT|nr:MAG: hypothetical protein COV57_01555 [Candidatus Liptonbacteria bacterium CG11_big_fil_rev_8_21_14_0_20_35_14]